MSRDGKQTRAELIAELEVLRARIATQVIRSRSTGKRFRTSSTAASMWAIASSRGGRDRRQSGVSGPTVRVIQVAPSGHLGMSTSAGKASGWRMSARATNRLSSHSAPTRPPLSPWMPLPCR